MWSAVLGGDDPRERAFRRALLASLGAHVVLLVIAAIRPWPAPTRSALPAVVDVTLVAAPPGLPPAPVAEPKPAPKPPPPKPKPKAEPKPEPKPEPAPVPPPPKVDKVLLPKESVQPPKPKPKPKAEPAPARPPAQESLDDMLERLRAEAGESAPEAVREAPQREAATVPAPAGGGGPGVRISAEEAAWRRRAKVHVTRAWVLAPGLRREVISTEVRVRLSASGDVLEVDVTRRSGNPWYDDSVVRAIEKASPLPPPPEAAEWLFVFSPQDLL